MTYTKQMVSSFALVLLLILSGCGGGGGSDGGAPAGISLDSEDGVVNLGESNTSNGEDVLGEESEILTSRKPQGCGTVAWSDSNSTEPKSFSLIGDRGKRWRTGSILRVALNFDDTEVSDFSAICPITDTEKICQSRVKTFIENTAEEWTEDTSVHFKFDYTEPQNSISKWIKADIRITFDHNKTRKSNLTPFETLTDYNTGSNSYVGTDALSIHPLFSTMNLDKTGWYDKEKITRTVLHEFGHALGLKHEHLRSDAPYIIDETAAYKYYKESDNWDEDLVKRNVLGRINLESLNFTRTNFDDESIMLYPLPRSIVVNNEKCFFSFSDELWCSERHFTLSSLDKLGMKNFYPKYNKEDPIFVRIPIGPTALPVLAYKMKQRENDRLRFIQIEPRIQYNEVFQDLKISVEKNPEAGRVTWSGKLFYYHSNENYVGKDKFTYRVDDPYGHTSISTVSITMVEFNKNLTLLHQGTGQGTISNTLYDIHCDSGKCEEKIPEESEVTLTVTPVGRSIFKGWVGSCSSSGTRETCNLTMDSDKIVIARFDKAPSSYILSVGKSGNGSGVVKSSTPSIDCGEDCSEEYPYEEMATVTLAAQPDSGSVFLGWNGACLGKDSCTVTMTNDKKVTASFANADPMQFTVSNLDDSGDGSLRQAVLDSNVNPGTDTVVFSSGLSGRIVLGGGDLVITDSINIKGPGARNLAISGNKASRIFTNKTGTNGITEITGLTLMNGYDPDGGGGGAILINSGAVTIDSVSLHDNESLDGGGGGAIRKFGEAPLTISNSAIFNNTALDEFDQGGGGGIRIDQGKADINIVNSTISGNSAADGGGMLIGFEATVTIANSTIVNNLAVNGGGGIFSAGILRISNNLIAGNRADRNELELTVSDGLLTSLGSNIIGKNGNLGVTTGIQLAENDFTLFGVLSTAVGPLSDNGGDTLTHLPTDNGPLINAGENSLVLGGIATDQRGAGFARIKNATVDIGSVER